MLLGPTTTAVIVSVNYAIPATCTVLALSTNVVQIENLTVTGLASTTGIPPSYITSECVHPAIRRCVARD